MSELKHEQIARELAARITASPSTALPSINELAAQFATSYQTMWKAVQALVTKGMIVTAPPKRICVAPRLSGIGPDESGTTSSDHRLYLTVKHRIESGEYRVRMALPKTNFFVYSESVSPLTVGRALKRLEREGLAHCVRRRWYAGPRTGTGESQSSSGSPVVLLLASDVSRWHINFANPFNVAFTNPIKNELSSHNIRLTPVVRDPEGQHGALSVPTGLDQVKNAAVELGSRYAGTLVLSAFPGLENLGTWLRMLTALRKPVVYFDSADNGPNFTRAALPNRTHYRRFHQDERTAVVLALRELAARGHATIGVHGGNLADWTQRRTRVIHECAHSLPFVIRIVEAPPAESPWSVENIPSEMTGIVGRVSNMLAGVDSDKRAASVSRSALRQGLLAHTLSLATLLRQEAPTALICLNDGLARSCYFWLRTMGYEIPRDISLVSFDNMPESVIMPLSTVDFGLERLGYLAAHVFVGDIPIPVDRNGFLPGVCTMVDRGSIAAPGNAARIRALVR